MVASYTASIDRSLLRSALLFGKLDRHAPGVTIASELSYEQVSAYIRSLVTQEEVAEVNFRENERALEH